LNPDDQAAAEALERFRQSGISIDREGRFWHEGGEITHDRTRRTFVRWLDRLPDGRFILRLDAARYVYVDVADAPIVLRSLRWQGDRAFVLIGDDSEEELDYAALRMAPDGAVYTAVRGGRLPARLAPSAWAQLSQRVSEHDGRPVLDAHGHSWPIRLG
jgi:hypothetical protein